MKKNLLLLLALIVALPLGLRAQFNVDDNLLLYLSFDETELSANDQEVDATNVTAVPGPGKFGKAAVFGDATYVSMTPIPAYNPRDYSLAFAFWIKTTVTTGEDIFVYNNITDPTGVDNLGRIAVSLRFDDILATDIGWSGGNIEGDPGPNNVAGLISDGEWHHVVTTWADSGKMMNIWIDKVLVDEPGSGGFHEEDDGDWVYTDFQLLLGTGCSDYPGTELGWASFFTGSIDEFRMYQTDEVLSANDVEAIYNYVPTISSVKPALNSQSVKIYPNPATDLLKIESAGNNVSVDIMNSIGQKVMSRINVKQIDISSLSKGIYFVKVTDGTSVKTQKLLVN